MKFAEEKMKQERENWFQQLTEMETTVNQLKSRENTLKSAISRLEKENAELCRELQSTGMEPDDAIPKAARFRRNSDDVALTKQLQLWRERAEFYMQEHAELLDKFESLRTDFDRMQADNFRLQNIPPKSFGSPRIQGSKTPNLGLVGRRTLKALQKKLPEKGRESSEFESEPEPVIYMPRVKRRLNRRERDERFWALSPERNHLGGVGIEPTTSEEELQVKRRKGIDARDAIFRKSIRL